MVIIIEKASTAGADFAYARGVLSASTRRDTRDFAQESVLRTVDWLQNQLVLWAFMTAKCVQQQNRLALPLPPERLTAQIFPDFRHILQQ